MVPTNRKQAVPRSRNRGTNYPRSAIFHPEGTFREYSVEYENVHDLWAYEIAGEPFLKELDFEDPNRITWLKTDRKSFVPSTWNDLLDFNDASNQIWMQD